MAWSSGYHSMPSTSQYVHHTGSMSSTSSNMTSVDTGEFQNRAESIRSNYDYLVSSLHAEELLDKINPYLSEAEQNELREISSERRELAHRIVQIVEQKASSDLFRVFMDNLSNIQPDLYKGILQNSQRSNNASGSNTFYQETGMKLSSDEKERRTLALVDNSGHLLLFLSSFEIREKISPHLSDEDRYTLYTVKNKQELAKRIVNLVKQHVTSTLYTVFMDCLSESQPDIHDRLTQSMHEQKALYGDEVTEANGPPQTFFGQSSSGPLDSAGPVSYPRTSSTKYKRKTESPSRRKEKKGFLEGFFPSFWGSSKKTSHHNETLSFTGEELSSGEDCVRDWIFDERKQLTCIDDLVTAEKESVKLLKLEKPLIEDHDVDRLCSSLANQLGLGAFHILGKKLSKISISKILGSLAHVQSLDKLSFAYVGWFENEIEGFTSFLSDKKYLTHLSLNQCRFTDGSWRKLAMVIKDMTGLTELSLNDTSMRDSGAESISQALSGNTGLKIFSVSKNQISDIGFYFIATCLNNKKNLEHLSLASNQITDEGLKHLAKVDQKYRQACNVNLADNQIGKDGAWIILTHWATTTEKKHHFNFDRNQIIISTLKSKHNTFSVKGNSSGKQRVEVLVNRISDGESFRYIDLSCMGLEDDDIQTLCLIACSNGNLEALALNGNKLTSKVLPFLIKMYHRCERLQFVNIKNNSFTDFSIVKNFTEDLPSIKEGRMDAPFILSKKFWDLVEDASEEVLHLDKENLGGNSVTILFQLITSAPLREIKIETCPLKESDIRTICKHVLAHRTVTETLVFTRNNFTPRTIAALADSFPKVNRYPTRGKQMSTEYKDIGLKRIVLRDNTVSPNSLKVLIDTVFRCPLLTHIDLANNAIGNNGAKFLHEYLAANPPLISLCLACNNIGNAGIQGICKAILKNRNLKHLSLAKNEIESKGEKFLAEALGSNSTLEFLDLSDNSIADAISSKEFSKGLKRNVSLTTLNLSNNFITDKGVCSLATGLDGNMSICKVDISKNDMQAEGLQSLLKALDRGRITHLDISDTNGLTGNVEQICQVLTSGRVSLSYLGLRNVQLNGNEMLDLADALGQSVQRNQQHKEGLFSLSGIARALGQDVQMNDSQHRKDVILDLSGHILEKQLQRNLTKIRIKYKSPRCVFDNVNGERDFFGSPF